MSFFLSRPAQELLHDEHRSADTVIVGSGYGAAMAALQLSAANPEGIWVLERGKEYLRGQFPKTSAELPGHVMVTGKGVRFGERDALFDVKIGDGVSALVGSGLGGTSLINGGVAISPSKATLDAWSARTGQKSWYEVLKESFTAVEKILGVSNATVGINTHPDPRSLRKHVSLDSVAGALRRRYAGIKGPRPIPLAITFASGPNAVGVHQAGCTGCGNCITGCNLGSKNTLAMNVWPLVQTRGVKLFTGAKVICVRRTEDGWELDVELTRDSGNDSAPDSRIVIGAKRVILAAGTFGSTEILMRSRAHLTLSRRLGERFSVNGDMIALALRRAERVNAGASAPSTLQADVAQDAPGPLTVSEIRAHVAGEDGTVGEVSIQDAAVPYPMRRFWGELMAVAHLARLFADGKQPLPGSVADDALAAEPSLFTHGQVITVMGKERTAGRLVMTELRHAPGKSGERVLEPQWDVTPEDEETSYFGVLEKVFEKIEEDGGFDGGHYVPCPPWRVVPKRLKHLEGLGDVQRHLLTTHPLGGCCMAADCEDGVVNVRGEVFDGSGGVHAGLYVMDGSIIPGPIGVNPFMTIAALAHHLASEIPEETTNLSTDAADARVPLADARMPFADGFPVPQPGDEIVAGVLRERLFLDHPSRGDRGGAVARRLRRRLGVEDDQRLVLDIETECPDLYVWLEHPSRPLTATFRFYTTTSREDTVGEDGLEPISDRSYRGDVILGGTLPPRHRLEKGWRLLQVRWRFLCMRFGDVVQLFRAFRAKRSWRSDLKRTVSAYGVQARVQSTWRYMRYEFRIAGESGQRPIHFVGQKTLAYTRSHLDPLSTLRALPFSIDGTTPKPKKAPRFRVDMIRFTGDPGPFQVTRAPDTPTTMLALASVLLFFLRAVVQTHFWSFGAPGYADFRKHPDRRHRRLAPPPPRLRYRCGIRRHWADRSVSRKPRPHPRMRLVCYRPVHDNAKGDVLLIHGLAHGSRVFWTDTIGINLTQHLLGKGFNVWLLDHRLSCNLEGEIDPKLSMDRIAATDIPWAVETVYESINDELPRESEKRKVRVLAHCIGAGAFEMAVLRGWVNPDHIDSAVLHAVTPWLVASEDNRWRANLISMLRSYFDDLTFDPVPNDAPTVPEMLGDRFANSFGWGREEFRLHRRFDLGRAYSKTICNRMTLFYGDEWVHRNLSWSTHANLDTLVGPAPIGVMKQIYYCIVKGRLTNREGANVYVRDDGLRHWTFPTLFLHGRKNKVFDCRGTESTVAELKAALARVSYVRRQVYGQIIPGYGHMDVLFGRRAHKHVFPHVSHFLQHHQPLRQDTFAAAGAPADSTQQRSPSITGPIVSRPSTRNGHHFVRLWCEVDAYHASPPNVWYAAAGERIDGRMRRACGRGSVGYLQHADVRLNDLDISGLDGRIDVMLARAGEPASYARKVETLDWRGLPWFRRIFGDTNSDSVSFLVGSCLYPGGPADRELADSAFGAMRPFIEGRRGRGVDHLLLVGDLIYADATSDLFDPVAPLERFRERYQRALGGSGRRSGRAAHWVLAHVPTYFAVDDHEISDNWPRGRRRRRHPQGERYSAMRELAFARGEACSFLMHEDGKSNELWYDFTSGGSRFFVFDTRTERKASDRRLLDTLINDPPKEGAQKAGSQKPGAQKAAFETWIRQGEWHNRPPVIVTGSPLGPITRDLEMSPALADHQDTLIGYPGFLCWLHEVLVRHGIKCVIWISGDVHLSSLSSDQVSWDESRLIVHQVTASGLFAPLPFANHSWSEFNERVNFERMIRTNGRQEPLVISGVQHLLSASSSHFVEVTLTTDSLSVQAHETRGRSGVKRSVDLRRLPKYCSRRPRNPVTRERDEVNGVAEG